ncbi:MAG TPA: DUF559 domain-containing protein [Acidothermaceae bacterium]
MPMPKPIPAALQDQPFSTAVAREAGVSDWQLAGARYGSPFHGVHWVGTPEGLATRCRAALVVVRLPAVFSHVTLARLMALPVLSGDERVHVTVAPGRAAPRHRGMVGHVSAYAAEETTELFGLPVTTAGRLFSDLAATFSRPSLLAIGDAILRGRHATVAELRNVLESRVGRRGSRRAIALLPLLNAAAESPMESVVRLLLFDGGLAVPEVNANIYDTLGRFLARADLLFRAARVIVEYDGDQHRTSREQFARDVARGSELAAAGYLVLRFTAAAVYGRPAYVLATVRAALASRGF